MADVASPRTLTDFHIKSQTHRPACRDLPAASPALRPVHNPPPSPAHHHAGHTCPPPTAPQRLPLLAPSAHPALERHSLDSPPVDSTLKYLPNSNTAPAVGTVRGTERKSFLLGSSLLSPCSPAPRTCVLHQRQHSDTWLLQGGVWGCVLP